MNKEITGGVTPLKARKSKGKAGKVGKKATATRAQDKSGFSRSGTVDTGKGYKANLESLTAGTRLTSSLTNSLKGSGNTSLSNALKGKNDFGKTDKFESTGIEEKQDPDMITTKTVGTDASGKVVKEEDKACSEAYIAKYGNAKCKEYKAFRKENPVDRSTRTKKQIETRKDGQKYQRTYKIDKKGVKIPGSEGEWTKIK